jgi:hypothetical protein
MTVKFQALVVAIVLVTAGACSREPAQAPAPAPTVVAEPAAPSTHEAETLVAELYREHDAHRGPFFQTDNKQLPDRYFEPSLADLIWKDAVDAKGEVGALELDPLYDAQDFEPKNFTIHPARTDGATALVLVSFDSFGQKRQLTFVLSPVAGTWKISDIRYTDGRTLRHVYRSVERPSASAKTGA